MIRRWVTFALAPVLALACSSSSSSDPAAHGQLCGQNAGEAAAASTLGCPAGMADCDGRGDNGCETNIASDVGHCGSCTATCSNANGTPSCAQGECAIACNPGFADCDGANANGCEVDTRASVDHCGACGTACSTANGTPSCRAGQCAIACNSGFGDCNGNVADGCETDTDKTVSDCGACGKQCVSFNGTSSCVAGVCVAACHPGFGDCDGIPQNGCETDVTGDNKNCGACGKPCVSNNGSSNCVLGACKTTCNAGFANCDNNAANGCEASLSNDINHCGACSTVCGSQNAIPSCVNGSCALSCSAGFGNCDGDPSNGCEHDLTGDKNNCGACGNVCVNACVAGVCQ